MKYFSQVVLMAALGLLSGSPSLAQADFPTRPVTLVVPFPPGGPTDVTGRVIAQQLSLVWGQPVVVDSRPGASGTIGTAAVARAPKDGYTLLLAVTTHVQIPALQRKMQYDAVKDFIPVSQIGSSTNVLVVSENFPAKNLSEFVAEVKAHPGKYSYGSNGIATTSHIYTELLKQTAGLDMLHVPYKGSGPLMTDLLGHQVQLSLMDVTSAAPQVSAGKLRALAVVGTERNPQLPQVPTFREAGFAGFEPLGWLGIFLPSGTPQAVVDKISADVVRVVAIPDVQKRMREASIEPIGSPAAVFGPQLKRDADIWRRVIEKTGIRLEEQ